jgi:hypothetical protein
MPTHNKFELQKHDILCKHGQWFSSTWTNNIVYKSCLRKLHYLLCNSITCKIILVSNSLLVANLLRYLDPAEEQGERIPSAPLIVELPLTTFITDLS